MAAWRNGNASDYESGDCRFDPCGGHGCSFAKLLIHVAVLLLMVMMIVFALYQAALNVSTQL